MANISHFKFSPLLKYRLKLKYIGIYNLYMKLKNLLIANPENNFQPWIVSKTAMACFVLSIWTLRLFLPGYIAIGAPGVDSADLMARINTERTNRNLPSLAVNAMLNNAANLKSQDMINREYFAHVDPDGNYAWPLVENEGYKPYKSLGENLAVDFTSAATVVNAWMNSPGHRANVLSEKYEDQGMAAVYGDFENHQTYLITNLFGTLMKSPTPSPTPAPVQAETPAPTPNPGPIAVVEPNPTPTPTPTTASETTPTQSSTESTTLIVDTEPVETSIPVEEEAPVKSNPVVTATNLPEKKDLYSLKIVIGIFAGLYTIFLGIDSYIIHRAKVNRINISSSPHAVLMLMIALVNLLTFWI